MPNAFDGVLRAMSRFRQMNIDHSATALRLQRTTVRLARRVVDRLSPTPPRRAAGTPPATPHRLHAAERKRRIGRRHLAIRLTSERTVPIGIAVVVMLAGIVSLGPALARPVGAVQGGGADLRLAIGGGDTGAVYDDAEIAGLFGTRPATNSLGGYLDDGTLYKPVAVDTSVQSASSLLRRYTVRSGDTLTGIASHFGLSMMTIWWANNLSSKDALKVGQALVIPPVNGLVVTVKAGDTLVSLATHYKVSSQSIVDANELTDRNLIVGQVLVMPGAQGAPIPAPKITVSSGSGGGSGTFTYVGGAWAWPVVGGNNYISQYYHYGHYGVDIAAQYGTKIVSPLAGRVIYAGWKSNGGGYQVWISHGNGLYTAGYHMSAVLVTVGEVVARGQQIGRVGMTGWATGTHEHFEVWIGYPWQSSSYRVNPLRYY